MPSSTIFLKNDIFLAPNGDNKESLEFNAFCWVSNMSVIFDEDRQLDSWTGVHLSIVRVIDGIPATNFNIFLIQYNFLILYAFYKK